MTSLDFIFNTDGNFREYVCKVSLLHIIFTDPAPVRNAASAAKIVAPISSVLPPYITTLPLLYLCPDESRG